jgi:hypothetical protein
VAAPSSPFASAWPSSPAGSSRAVECTYTPPVPDSPTAVRAARNESVFREVNEQLEAAASASPSDDGGFVCECADVSCTTLLKVPLDDYQRVRECSERFIVAPGAEHVDPMIETVVERTPGFWVVEKQGIAGEAAGRLDPNSTRPHT